MNKSVLTVLVMIVPIAISACFRRDVNPTVNTDDIQNSMSAVVSDAGTQTDVTGNGNGTDLFTATHASNEIAIVNLDEGIEINGRLQVYSNQIIQFTSDDIFSYTSLSEARTGIETGRYGAYIIIPATFSSSVESINTTPSACNLEYVIDSQSAVQTDLLRNIYEFYMDLNNRISYMYLANILSNFHEAQDNARTVISNDIYDYDVMTGIQPNDLTSSITLTETTLPENNTQPLNIDGYSQAMSGMISSINESYSASATDINERLTTINESLAGFSNAARDAATGLSSYRESINSIENLQSVTQAQHSDLLNLFSGVDEYGAGSDALVNALHEDIDILDQSLARSLTDYRESIINSIDRPGYFECSVNDDDGVVEIRDGESIIRYISLDADEESGEEATVTLTVSELEELVESIQSRAFDKYGENIDDIRNRDADISGISLYDQNGRQITYTTESGDNIPMSLEYLVSDIVDITDELSGGLIESEIDTLFQDYSLYADAFTSYVNGQIADINEQLDTSKTGIIDVISSVENAADTCAGTITDNRVRFDPGAANAGLSSLQNYAYSIWQAATENNTEQVNYTHSVLMAESENMRTLQQNIFDAQALSNQTVAEGLENAISVRIRTSDENQLLMNDFIGMLPNTRLGTLENTTTYQFIANPITLTESSGH